MAKRPFINSNWALPTQKSPLSGYEGDTCGSSYHFEVEVRRPYLGRDDHFKKLGAIAPYEVGATSSTPEEAVAYIDSGVFDVAFDGFRSDLTDHIEAGRISGSNESAILTMTGRARRYYDEAVRLENYYREVRIDYAKSLPWGSWSLVNPSEPPEWCRGDRSKYRRRDKHGKDIIELTSIGELLLKPSDKSKRFWNCPDWVHITIHQHDKSILTDLVRAAIINLRCAQEAAYSVAIYNMNKRKAGMGSLSSTMPTGTTMLGSVPGGSVPQGGPGRSASFSPGGGAGGDGEVVIDNPPPEPEYSPYDEPSIEGEEPAASSVKKGSNALLLVGAAAVGLLLLSKK